MILDLLATFLLILMTGLIGEAAKPDFWGWVTMAAIDAFIIWRIFV